MRREDWMNKSRHWKDEFKSAMQRYWAGTKLIWLAIRISYRLLLKLARGRSLSRRERRQLTRRTADIFRVVPFMELLLPVFLKTQSKKWQRKSRTEEVARLRNLLKFWIRKGAHASNEEILRFAKLFNDELTLDNIRKPRLVSMCKYLGISPYGSEAYLRYMLQKRIERGRVWTVESLSEAELRHACRDRGLLDEVVDAVGITSMPPGNSLSDKRRKLEFLQKGEEHIRDEEQKEKEQATLKGSGSREEESGTTQEDVALKEMRMPTAKEAQQHAKEKLWSNKSSSSVCRESEAFLRLVNKEVDAMLQNLGKEINDVDAKIGESWRLLDMDSDGKGTPEEVAAAAMYLKDTLRKEGVQEFISKLSKKHRSVPLWLYLVNLFFYLITVPFRKQNMISF
ncbi:hypothetical protein IFM89_025454 [Coptis chinensis]|uniref:Letm1 RBD domain-containing protein n=1 Tax=Coptis chinensis TaxID=261450 RepID=A0A835ICU3_9MAGN|nr:hypothetical protein IFM89_025454 [Coptis chinensis]